MKYLAILVAATALFVVAGCESVGFTQAEVDAAAARAGGAAYEKAIAETRARMLRIFVDMGMEEAAAAKLADAEAEKAGEIARTAAEELVRRTMPVKPPGGGESPLGKIAMMVLGAGLQFGLSYAEVKARER